MYHPRAEGVAGNPDGSLYETLNALLEKHLRPNRGFGEFQVKFLPYCNPSGATFSTGDSVSPASPQSRSWKTAEPVYFNLHPKSGSCCFVMEGFIPTMTSSRNPSKDFSVSVVVPA